MKALPDSITIDMLLILCIMDRQIDCLHSQQIWVSGY